MTYNGKEMTRYEGEQKQREIERTIRKYKRMADAEQSAGLDDTHYRQKVGEWQAPARDFTKQTGLVRDYSREYVGTVSKKQPREKKVSSNKSNNMLKSSMSIRKDKNQELAEKLHPSTNFTKIEDKIYIAEERTSLVEQKELEMAKILVEKTKKSVFLTPEEDTHKNYDAIFDSLKFEFKEITGSRNQIGSAFNKAKEKGKDVNVFLNVKTQNVNISSIYNKIKGEVMDKGYESGLVYVFYEGTLHQWNIETIKNNARK